MSGAKVDVLELWPVIEFRPLPDFFRGDFRRYAGGLWLPDDGEHDLAFIGHTPAPVALYVDLPYQQNIIASWFSKNWYSNESKHPNGNAWHYHLRHGKRTWGGAWNRDRHPNEQAGQAGMNKMSSEARCCNGRAVTPADICDEHIAAKLVRERETKTLLEPPRKLRCMYCGDDGAAALARASATQP